jgi:hypothetical protein
VTAFYDLEAAVAPSLEAMAARAVLFKIWVMDSAVTKGRWQVIGNAMLEPELLEPTTFFKQDPITENA